MEICNKNLRPAVPSGLAEWFQISEQNNADYELLMSHCWRRKSEERPSFDDIQSQLTGLHQRMAAFQSAATKAAVTPVAAAGAPS